MSRDFKIDKNLVYKNPQLDVISPLKDIKLEDPIYVKMLDGTEYL